MSKLVNRENLKAFREKLDDKYVIEGEYSPSTSVGLADEAENLTPYGDNSGANDTTPFVFQTSGGNSDIGALAYLRALRGKSYVMNQIIADNFVNSSWWSRNRLYQTNTDNVASFTVSSNAYSFVGFYHKFLAGSLIKGHKYLMSVKVRKTSGSANLLDIGWEKANGGSGSVTLATISNPTLNTWYVLGAVFTQENDNTEDTNGFGVEMRYASTSDIVADSDSFQAKEPMVFDLTLMFGAGNEPTSVLEFNRLFPEPYYAYNTGELISSKSSAYKIVGYNAFDGELEMGDFSDSTGEETPSTSTCRTVNSIKVIPGQKYSFYVAESDSRNHKLFEYDADGNFVQTQNSYYNEHEFTLSNRTQYVRFSISKDFISAECCFHLSWDGSKTGYEPYYTETYPLPNVELRSAGSAYDELKPDGTKTTIIGSYTFTGNEIWTSQSYDRYYATISSLIPIIKFSSINILTNANLTAIGQSQQSVNDNTISIHGNGNICIRSTSQVTSEALAASFMAGKTIYFELATPTETQDDSYKYQESTKIDDYGTQEFVGNGCPQGNEFFYPVDYKAFVDSLGGRADIEYDASEIVSQTELSASETERNTVDSQLKNAIGGALRQLLATSQNIDFSNTLFVDLGTLTWTYASSSGHEHFETTSALANAKYDGTNTYIAKMICTLYTTTEHTPGIYSHNTPMGIAIRDNGRLSVYNSSYTDANTFKKAMAGVLLAYEKA